MFIVPLFPAFFANRLFANWTSHSRGSAPLLPILWTQFSSELLSVSHPTVFPRFHPKTFAGRYTYSSSHVFRICTPQLLLLSSSVDAQYLWWSPSNKKTFVAIAWEERVLSHKEVRSFVWFTIPLKTDSVVHDRQCYLKVFHCFCPMSLLIRKHTTTYAAWITLSNAQQKILR